MPTVPIFWQNAFTSDVFTPGPIGTVLLVSTPGPRNLLKNGASLMSPASGAGTRQPFPDASLITITNPPPPVGNDFWQGTLTYPDTDAWAGFQLTDYVLPGDSTVWRSKHQPPTWRGIPPEAPVIALDSITYGGRTAWQFNFSFVQGVSPVVFPPAPDSKFWLEVDAGGTVTRVDLSAVASATFRYQYEKAYSGVSWGPLRARVIDNWGQKSAWITFGLMPEIAFTADLSNEPVIAVDARDSFDADGSIVDYHWQAPDADPSDLHGQPETLDFSNSSQDSVPITLTITDNDGNTLTLTQTYPISPGGLGGQFDPASRHWMAVKNGSGVDVVTYVGAADTREVYGTIAGSAAPSLWLDGHGRVWVLVRDTGSQTWALYRNRGTPDGEFDKMAEPFDSTYAGVTGCGTQEGGALAVGVKKSPAGPDVYCCYSPDGITWQAPVLVGTLPAGAPRAARVDQAHYAASSEIVVRNGLAAPNAFSMKSLDYGVTWSQF